MLITGFDLPCRPHCTYIYMGGGLELHALTFGLWLSALMDDWLGLYACGRAVL